MKQVPLPTCEVCGSTSHVYESSDPHVRVCYQCLKAAADYLSRLGLVDSNNPLLELLFDGVWYSDESKYEVWHLSPYSSNARIGTIIERNNQTPNKCLDLINEL